MKKLTKLECFNCGKEIGFVTSTDWRGPIYYCYSCKINDYLGQRLTEEVNSK